MLKPGLYKFVCVGDHDFRFFDNDESHDQQVNESEKTIVTQAGTVAVFETYWKLYSNHSLSLNIHCDFSVIPRLTRLIGKPYKEAHDYSEIKEEKPESYEDLVGEGLGEDYYTCSYCGIQHRIGQTCTKGS